MDRLPQNQGEFDVKPHYSMTSKWTYVDFLMYVLPGSFVVTAALVSLWSLAPEIVSSLFTSATGILLSIVLAFLAGALVQAVSHGGPESRLRNEYWLGYCPSTLMFFQNRRLLSEQAREEFLDALKKLGVLTESVSRTFESLVPPTREAAGRAQDVFDYALVALQERGHADRIRGAEGHYQLFRGLFVAGFWAAVVFLAPLIVNGIRISSWPWTDFLGNLSGAAAGLLVPALGFFVCTVSSGVFRKRCCGIAEGLAKEVQRAAYAAANVIGVKPDTHPAGVRENPYE